MKTELIKARASKAEKQSFQQAADLAGLPLSAWVRERLRRAARLELQEAGKEIPFVQAQPVAVQNGLR
jgi:uncharacterized protein (DUF1778 family)